jgi:TolA-binding protein
MKNLKILISVFILNSLFFSFSHLAQGKDNDDFVEQITKAKNNQQLYANFEAAKEFYFKENKYNDFIEFLNSISQKQRSLASFVNYYTGLSRYHQLKFLEEKQNWDEYFSQGNNYRDQLSSSLKQSIKSTAPQDKINLYSRLILWQFHEDQQDAFAQTALSDLMSEAQEYAKSASELNPLKEVADKLLSYGKQVNSKELYKIYIDKIASADIKDEELKSMAEQFLKEGKFELAQTIYDVYIERILKVLPREKFLPVLIDIAKLFAYKDEGVKDVFYAQKLFKKIEELGGKEAFDEELTYLAGFNAEKAKEFNQAKDYYIVLLNRFPQTKYADEAAYKTGVIFTYLLGDLRKGKEYFKELAQKETVSPEVISSLYQLGLLSQWQGALDKAKEYYDKLIENFSAASPNESLAQTKERLKELEESKPLAHNLKIFLDISLEEEYANFNMSKVDLKSALYRPPKDNEVNINSTAYPPQSGCMQVVVEYLWSGDLGKTEPPSQDSSFTTSYSATGTKVINLVVTTPSGIIDRAIDLVNVE